MGSYPPGDVTFLLKEINGLIKETGTEDREELIQTGHHYSEMLPIEYRPTKEYIELFHQTLQTSAKKVALAVAIVAELIKATKGNNVVIASLARAGTPIGILIKRYLESIHRLHIPHYSISIIRGKGIDENALLYMLDKHPGAKIQFVDGWTGKGAITRVLQKAIQSFNEKLGTHLDDDLAVLADPGHCVSKFGTREDFLIPSACLNSTVSGLVSRTVHRQDLIGPADFHGAKYYREWLSEDVSNLFVDTIAKHFHELADTAKQQCSVHLIQDEEQWITWSGERDIQRIQQDYKINDINLIKPGVGETTRVLLRRVPWKILVNRMDNPYLAHILLLAHDRGVLVEERSDLSYSCCGIIRPQGEDNR
ncbi:cysteine protease StiP family protein [Brevibacillus porteri]|uniref:cysteine protease StiP family protein n=1 Tax=Brevibacillus porteri TaxID=2126350 RepID=UPI00370A33A3